MPLFLSRVPSLRVERACLFDYKLLEVKGYATIYYHLKHQHHTWHIMESILTEFKIISAAFKLWISGYMIFQI